MRPEQLHYRVDQLDSAFEQRQRELIHRDVLEHRIEKCGGKAESAMDGLTRFCRAISPLSNSTETEPFAQLVVIERAAMPHYESGSGILVAKITGRDPVGGELTYEDLAGDSPFWGVGTFEIKYEYRDSSDPECQNVPPMWVGQEDFSRMGLLKELSALGSEDARAHIRPNHLAGIVACTEAGIDRARDTMKMLYESACNPELNPELASQLERHSMQSGMPLAVAEAG